MEVCRALDKLKGKFNNPAITLGNFDGVHLGHQKIFTHLLKRASDIGGEALVFTFDPHPVKVLRPELSPSLITPTHEKLKLMKAFGINAVILTDFTKEFAAIHPSAFVEDVLINTLGSKLVVVGHDFSFGKGKEGTIDYLKVLGKRHKIHVEIVDALKVNGEIVSSTAIRKLIHSGKMTEAAKLLGRQYSIEGKVIQGSGRGKQLGFPTANLKLYGELIPKDGVYAIKVTIGEAEKLGIANIGLRPTFRETERSVEIHIFGFKKDIYNEDLKVTFIERIREERGFSSPEELTQQIQKDIVIAKKILERKEN